MDATQTSDPTGVGPGTPGQASAFRRALDDQALDAGVAKEGPLDLTVPLDFAEIRAVLSSSGSNPKPPPPEDLPPPVAEGGGPRRRRRGGDHAAPPGHTGSKRLGRIGVFVALATAFSVGTAAALVLSSGGQGASVSLPTTNGNLPVVTALAGGPGQVPTSSAAAGSNPSSSPGSPSPSPSASASSSASASPTQSGTPTAAPSTSQASSSASADPSPSQAPASPTVSSSPFTDLQQGSSGSTVTTLQQMLAEVDLLRQQRQRHDTVFVYVRNRMIADPSGSYGDATANAVAAFQQANGVGAQLGVCDQATFDALAAQAAGQ
ncbi:peptidoglycan-binding domain-containing protein [Actinospica robiniae]|uniref:peptidoglycan-binding domain-containing protein n=1 Tax=Actinospica robiniae TaxID=304901 RepID=UPI000418BBE8|nr:peptidoglycan-binding domain-containing protein [Actinospica robiniae]